MNKKFINWIFKGKNVPFVILSILIIPLYLIFSANYINQKAVDFLISIATIVSTIFLYLALRENRISNHLKAVEPKFNDLINEVLKLEELSSRCIFSDPHCISTRIHYSDDYVSATNYLNFLNLINIYNAIRIDSSYKYCIDRLGNDHEIQIDFDEKMQNLNNVMNQIIEGNRNIMSFLFNISLLYSEIDKSELIRTQKKYLFDKMDILYKNFSSFYNTMKEKGNDKFEMFNNFYKFKIFKGIDINRIGLFQSEVQWQFIFMSCKDIENIQKKYNS
jgi:hypothetical protein